MASASQSLRLVCRSCRHQRPIPRVGPKIFVAWKSVSGSSFKMVHVKETEATKPTPFDDWEREFEEQDLKYKKRTFSQIATEGLSAEDLSRFQGLTSSLAAVDARLKKAMSKAWEDSRNLRRVPPVNRNSFWDQEGDPDLITNDDGDDFDDNDMTELGHAKLEEIREQRAWARTAIWEMPLLSKLAKPFEPPAQNMPLRFRYTTYMGEFHPAEKKVVVEFCAADLGLTGQQRDKLHKLVGPRYNPETQVIKMSCEMFEHQAQNKRYLGDLVAKLVAEAKDPTDTFADIPLDTRYHKFKRKPQFPLEWRMTDERRQKLAAVRKQGLLLDAANEAQGKVVDGLQAIHKYLEPDKAAAEQFERVFVKAGVLPQSSPPSSSPGPRWPGGQPLFRE